MGGRVGSRDQKQPSLPPILASELGKRGCFRERKMKRENREFYTLHHFTKFFRHFKSMFHDHYDARIGLTVSI